MELSQNPQISSDPETKGFDLSAGQTWIYPENYPIRDYQFKIVQASLYMNTIVCLPTGLGKTFIAAVVMYNFWRWYPCGKVVFLAPTKPLVTQQIFACHDIMGIPSIETVELTGAIAQKHREVAWSKKRVVFATPQVFHNDLEKNIVPDDLVKCVVVDEAHKALGKHSYCECIRILSERNQNFRVLALSATPGNKIDNVHEVLQNLHIAHMELRDETSSDIIPYINQRKIDIILVPLNDQLAKYKERYIFIMDRHVKVLLQNNVLHTQTANISKGRVFHLLREFQKKTNKSGNYGQIMKTLNILMTMYHGYELMIRDGLRAFHKFYQNHSDKFWMNEETQLQELLEDIQMYLGPFPDIKSLSDQSTVDIPQNLVFGHTKFEKLKELLVHHFKNSQEKQSNTRAIVFVEYRDIVSEVYVLLLQCRPVIRPQMFVGQAGQKQKQQIKALHDFRSNHVNVLISTSIGEEGLDVGEVDLIICFDISQHSPTRLVQRMGRTGRKRDGHIIILVTDGREHQTLKATMARRDSLNSKILNTSNIFSSLYQNNPRMIPDIFTPECLRMYINTQPKMPITRDKTKKGKLDKKTNKHKNTLKKITAIESNMESQIDKNKFSIVKFFKSEKHKNYATNTFETSNSNRTQTNNVHQVIKPSDVKILSCDSDAVDFLTLCTLRNSERELNREKKGTINKVYVPECSPIKNFFNFTIPDIKILDCLITLTDIIPAKCKKTDLGINNHSANDSDGNNSYNNDSYTLTNMIEEVDTKCTVEESKFEDLLDDSSKSDNSVVILDNIEEVIKSSNNRLSTQDQYIDVLKETTENIDDSQDLNQSRFEDILNETSDDSENNARAEDFKQIDTCNNVNIETTTNNLKVDDNVELYTMCSQEMFEFNDNITLPHTSRHIIEEYENKTKNNITLNICKTKDQSLLSVTQAISEIQRIKSNKNVSNTVYDSEDDMFEDESFLMQIDDEKNFDRIIDCSTENKVSNDMKNLNVSSHLDDKKNAIDTEFKVEEYEWDDDFQICTDYVGNYAKFDPSKTECEQFKEVENKVKERDSDSDGWFSVEKTHDFIKKNVPRTSIAKKLADIRNSNKYTKNEVKPESNLFVSKKDELLKTSYFFNKPEDNFDEREDTRGKLKHSGTCAVKSRNCTRRPRKVRNEFIDDEAKVSSNDEYSADESSEADQDLEDFVSYTQNVHDTTNMHAVYLQTVKSPLKRHNEFLFKQPRTPNPNVEIYSQQLTQTEESYLEDSFCVAVDDEDKNASISTEELSELEKVELELERKKRKRGRGKRLKDSATRRTKRRNIIHCSTSSEDETEKLREQIKDESLLLAQSSGR
ncbi:FA complementation group M isoform X1 [Ptiloglossa arizonensis]|uniref:FA complementation group M isoform X1 n=1 Tax=Ptiloglossa arizonensis TaxID=3350558 RepID=UPI003FA13299